MRTLTAGQTTLFAAEVTTLATCWRVTLENGTVKRFTDHDRDLLIDGDTYLAAAGYTPSDVDTTAELNVDNLEVLGILESPAIVEADLLAGLWDHAGIEIFLFDYTKSGVGPYDTYLQRVGYLGEVSVERGKFKAELRGLMQFYQTTIGQVDSPSCRADLGDARCQVDLSGSSGFTVTGTVEGVSADNTIIYDSARVEAGPTGGIAITAISNANPGVVTLAAVTGLNANMIVTMSGITGPEQLNMDVQLINLDTTAMTFELGIDTSDTGVYPPYTGGGTVTPLGSDSGFFEGGKITFTSGDNNGLSMEVKHYVPGQIVLHLPMPYPIAVNDTYSMVAGCDKSFATCRDRFNNVLNFRGEPHLPGVDRLVQIGRHE